MGRACAAVDISRWTAYHWRKEMPEFAEAWDEAMKAGLIALEDEAHRRAFEGVDKPLTHQGQFTPVLEPMIDELTGEPVIDELTGTQKWGPVLDKNGRAKVATVKEYSDTLAIFLLKAHAPEKYRERADVNVTGELRIADAIVAARQRSGG